MSIILQLSDFYSLSEEKKREYIHTVEQQLRSDFVYLVRDKQADPLPTFKHVATGIKFKLILSGHFQMGLSLNEEEAARMLQDPPPFNLSELRPVQDCIVFPFLLSCTPVTIKDFKKLKGKMMPASPYDSDLCPAYVLYEEAKQFVSSFGCRLPSEVEWEYACRGGTHTLFIWGNRLLPNSQLELWVIDDLAMMRRLKHNGFGLYTLFSGEWCNDLFTVSHEKNAAIIPGSYVVKGGGAYFWPWQADEWVWCMPAMRMPSSDLPDGRCAFRLARSIS